MNATKARGLGRQYAQLLWGYRGPLAERGWSNETEAPYRYGHCLVLRAWPFPLALAVGRWHARCQGPGLLSLMLRYLDPGLEDSEEYDMLLDAATGQWESLC